MRLGDLDELRDAHAGGAAHALPHLLREVLDQQFNGIQQLLAEAIGVSGSRLGRVLRGEFSLSVLSCLKLAKASGRSASTVLRVAGKQEVADLLEELYGSAVTPLKDADRKLLDRWHALRAESQRTLNGLIDELRQVQGHVRKGKQSA